MPAISDCSRFQPSARYAKVPAERNGAKKDTAPIERLARHSRRNCGTSTSAPARNVSTMPANEPRNDSQFGRSGWNAFPTITPAVSSIKATDRPISTEIVLATRIAPPRTAASAKSPTAAPFGMLLVSVGRGHQPRRAVRREPHRASREMLAKGADSGFDPDGRPVQCVERRADVHLLADEDRRVALGVTGRLGLAQRQHQMHEVRRLVALERGHELLVVDPKRVCRVVVDRLELGADPHA